APSTRPTPARESPNQSGRAPVAESAWRVHRGPCAHTSHRSAEEFSASLHNTDLVRVRAKEFLFSETDLLSCSARIVPARTRGIFVLNVNKSRLVHNPDESCATRRRNARDCFLVRTRRAVERSRREGEVDARSRSQTLPHQKLQRHK